MTTATFMLWQAVTRFKIGVFDRLPMERALIEKAKETTARFLILKIVLRSCVKWRNKFGSGDRVIDLFCRWVQGF